MATDAPAAGKITTIRQHVSSGVWSITLSNGVLAHHREMEGKLELAITLSGGALQEGQLSSEALRAAVHAMGEPATRRLDHAALTKILRDADIRVEAMVGVDSVSLRISAEPSHAELAFELAHAVLSDAVVDREVFERWRKLTPWELREKAKWTGEALQRRVGMELARDGSPAFAPPDPDRITGLAVEQAESALREIARTCAIEVGIAGDLRRAVALDLAATYLGAISQRPAVQLARPAREAQAIEISAKMPDINGLGVFVGFLGPPLFELDEARALRLAADVLDERLIAQIPDGEVAGRYEPRATAGGRGVLYGVVIGSSVDAMGLIREEIERLAIEGPSEEELEQAGRERYRRGREILDRPRYWAGVLSDQTRLGLEIDEIRRAGRAYIRIGIEDVQRSVGRVLSDDRAIRVTVSPQEDE